MKAPPNSASAAICAVLKAAWSGALILVLLVAAAGAAPDFPQLTGRVVDNANLIDAAAETELTGKLEQLEKQTTDQLVVVTLPDLQGETIEGFGYQLGRHWAIGQKDRNNGALLIVAVKERKVRIEVGYGLEGKLTDALTRIIIDQAIVPQFRQGDFQGGIVEGTDLLITALTDGAEAVTKQQRFLPRTEEMTVDDWISLIWTLIIISLVIYHFVQVARGKRSILSTSGTGGSWSSGGGGWSGGGGGGFSGGGGSFGGGGSSGSW
ncbi:MAG: TPM domain-containing protein [Pseudomonadota bacterium]